MIVTAAAAVSAESFPRLYAAASLKHRIEGDAARDGERFPRLYAAASLKRLSVDPVIEYEGSGFPRLYAAASLKRDPDRD